MNNGPEKIRPAKGLIIAAPASGSGKTLVTLSLLRALKRNGVRIASAKVGPDYIDPAFHNHASGRPCFNLDTWAMRPVTIVRTLNRLVRSADLIITEGVMGLFDGAAIDDDRCDGSTASLARITGWPVVLVVDARAQAASVAALVRGFSEHMPEVSITGVVFNRVGSESHGKVLRKACARHVPHISVLGCLPRQEALVLPERHLGLVQAGEHDALDGFLNQAADWVRSHIDLGVLENLAKEARVDEKPEKADLIAPLGQRIAVARDQAFAFCYAGLLQDWHDRGAEILPFSPLAGECPNTADSIYLPGGYPELHAGQLAAGGFFGALRQMAEKGTPVYGECGGYMVLGSGLVDAEGRRHEMAGLLDVETSFAERKLHLGYRRMETLAHSSIGDTGAAFRGHEFHYASVISRGGDAPLFDVTNAAGDELGTAGSVRGRVAGSFMHLIDCAVSCQRPGLGIPR